MPLRVPLTRARSRASSGFTLLELIVAIAVFAVLGLMSSQLLTNIIRQHEIIEERGGKLIGLQRAMSIMQRDVSQIWARGIRDEYGQDFLYPFHVGQDRPIEFTRAGWRNPLGHQRSELQRVAYEHRDTTLYRYYWPVLDRAIDTEPFEQVLMEDVLSIEFEPLDGNGDTWPQPGVAPGAPSVDPRLQLVALNVRFEIEGYGEINRLWEIPQDINRAGSGIPGLPGGQNPANPNSGSNSGSNTGGSSGGNSGGNAGGNTQNPGGPEGPRRGDVRGNPAAADR